LSWRQINGINNITKDIDTGIETTGSKQGYDKFSNAEIENGETTTRNDGLSNNNKNKNSKQKFSNIKSSRNKKQ